VPPSALVINILEWNIFRRSVESSCSKASGSEDIIADFKSANVATRLREEPLILQSLTVILLVVEIRPRTVVATIV
jgi:hypothetical protein